MNKFVLAATAALLVPMQATLASHRPPPSLIGVWTMEVTLRNCATGDPLPGIAPFPALNTFHKGGTLTEFGARFSPATRGVGQGDWKRTGRATFSSHFFFYRFDAGGLHVGGQDVRRTIRLSDDGAWLTSTATVEITDVNGVVIARGCATEDGSRL
jgi:hypothetical protein